MTAPGTPNLGPHGFQPATRSGSVSGSPWQLVEVSSEAAAALRSNPASPNLMPLPSAAVESDAGEDTESRPDTFYIGDPHQDAAAPRTRARSGWADWLEDEHYDMETSERHSEISSMMSSRWPGRSRKSSAEDDGFDPGFFVGEWVDNLGHKIFVVPGNPNRGNARRRGRGPPPISFLATLSKPDAADKKFNISRDQGKQYWTCGNGQLLPDESSMEALVWQTGDGRTSTWTRSPPEGPVYFDAPPEGMPNFYGPQPLGPLYFNEDQQFQPLGPVYFDPAPKELQEGQQAQPQGPPVYFDPPQGESSAGGVGAAPVGHVYFVMQQPAEWSEDWTDAEWKPEEGKENVEFSMEVQEVQEESNSGGGAAKLNAGAPEFVPASPAPAPAPAPAPRARTRSSSISTPVPSPKLGAVPPSPKLGAVPGQRWGSSPAQSAMVSPSQKPAWGRTPSPSPMLGPLPPPTVGSHGGLLPPAAVGSGPGAAPQAPPNVDMEEEHPDMRAEDNLLEWSLPENWGRLSRYPKDFCLTSPMFGVKRCPSMQLAFYPNGSRTAEDGQCTVALTRGPESAGIKFEFKVNGRSIGPKVCLGRRYLGDYPKPFDCSDDSKLSRVSVCMEVLEILGGADG